MIKGVVMKVKRMVCGACVFAIQGEAHIAGLEDKPLPKIKGLDVIG